MRAVRALRGESQCREVGRKIPDTPRTGREECLMLMCHWIGDAKVMSGRRIGVAKGKRSWTFQGAGNLGRVCALRTEGLHSTMTQSVGPIKTKRAGATGRPSRGPEVMGCK